jgi:septum site-determining protein MinD
MGKIVGVLSLKGGVGKTSTVVALGAALAGFGKRVLLIDGNFSAPNLGMHLHVVNPEVSIHHVLHGSADIKEAIHNFRDFDFIPASIFFKGKISPLQLKNKIRGLKRKYDVILIDSPPSLNEEALAVMLASDELFVVTTPDYPTLSSTLKAIKSARKRGIKINGLVLNKVRNKNFELSIDEIEDTVEVPVLAVIPEDVNILKSQANFTPSVTYKPKSKGSEEYKKLAALIVGEKYKPANARNFLRITPRREEINREVFYESLFK